MSSYFPFAKLAYASPSPNFPAVKMAKKIDSRVIKTVFVDTLADAQYYKVEFENKLVFAFRGSSSTSDFLADASIFMTQFDELENAESVSAKVHRGFYRQFNSINTDIISSVKEFVYALSQEQRQRLETAAQLQEKKGGVQEQEHTPEIICVGHSLGGSLATLCAVSIKAAMKNTVRVSCETYGSPRVGNFAFVTQFNALVDNSARFVNSCDAITLSPKLWYYHVKGLIQLGKGPWSWWWGSIEDHYLDGYEKALLKDILQKNN